jgi:hypothetical protein
MPPFANRLQVFIVMLMSLALFFRFLIYVDSHTAIREKQKASVVPPYYQN